MEKHKRWVSKTSKKRYAYPTKGQALESFMARKKRLIDICEHKIKVARIALEMARHMRGE